MSNHGIEPPKNSPRQFTDEEIRAMYPGTEISPNRGIPLTQQQLFDRLQRNIAAMNTAKKRLNRERILARRFDKEGE